MNASIYPISVPGLFLSLIPLLVVVAIFFKWELKYKTILHATARMFLQLVFIGYVLTLIFEQNSPIFINVVLLIMLSVASWIALRPIAEKRKELYVNAFFSIFMAGFPILFFVIHFIIHLDPWYDPRYLIPLGGMTFSNAMNAVSLAGERCLSEVKNGIAFHEARKTSLSAALLPMTNTLFAVGLVSLPGMMTGQILAGVEPLVAVRYQIMIMSTIFGACGISAAIFLTLLKKTIEEPSKK